MSKCTNSNKNKRGGKLFRVVGQCEHDKYSHDYLGCPDCKVSRDLMCFLKDCPCKGKAFLFKVEGDDNYYSHQMEGHLSSVRVYMNRPGRSHIMVKSAMERNMKMLQNPEVIKRHRTSKRNRDDEVFEEIADIEGMREGIDNTLDVSAVFDTHHYDFNIILSETEETNLGVIQCAPSPVTINERKRRRTGCKNVNETSDAASATSDAQFAASLAYNSEGDDDQEFFMEM